MKKEVKKEEIEKLKKLKLKAISNNKIIKK